MRVPVVEPPKEGAPRLDRAPLTVGGIEWFDPDPVCTAIVKITYTLGEEGLALAKEQRPLVALPPEAMPLEERRPYDFAPYKPRADVIVIGDTAYAERPTPQREIPVRFSVGSLSRSVRVIPEAPAARARLGDRNVLSSHEDAITSIGPRFIEESVLTRRVFLEDFDYSVHQLAEPSQQRDELAPGEPVKIAGLFPHGEVELTLPREIPRVLVFFKGSMPRAELDMVADTLLIDAVREEIVLIYRGLIALPRPGSVDRFCVALAPARAGRKFAEILRSAARGSFTITACPENLDPSPASPEEADDIARVRYDFATQPEPPEPTMPLEQYTAISAELAEQREPRADVLERHDLDEDRWMLEERAWLETIASRAMAGDGTLAVRYGELFVAAQDALASPAEARWTLEDYANISVALDYTEDIPRELADRGLRLAEWLRLDRRMKKAAGEDDAIAEDLKRHLAAAHRAAGGEP
jgi:hypothetical protein